MLKVRAFFIVFLVGLLTTPVWAQAPKIEGVAPLVEKASRKAYEKDLYSQVELFSYALTTVQSEYVEEKEPKDVIYGALTGMLSSLDPHSQFLTPEDYEDLKTETEGKFGGLGIEISIRDALLTVVTPIEGTPAWEIGLRSGDRIVKIEDDLTRDMTLSDAVKRLRGDPGTSVHITVLRESEYKVLEFDITREIIHIEDVKDVHIIADDIGYIRLTEFREDSFDQFSIGTQALLGEGAKSLIIDLRNNPGGLLNIAIKISEIFLGEGMTIVSTKGRHPSQNAVSISQNKKDVFKDFPIVVLINEGSASGSEIMAGALRDNMRAVTLGAKSFGKGSVQSVIPLPDGAGLRLTTSKYYTPSGVSIHEVGITPDIEVKRIYPKDEKDEDALEVKKGVHGKKDLDAIFDKIEEENADIDGDPHELDKKKQEAARIKRMEEDNQIQAAVSVVKGIQVYKGLQIKEGQTL